MQCHETLTYLDLTFIPHLTLHIQKLPAHLHVYKYEVKQCFCTNCSEHNSLQDCVHIKIVEACFFTNCSVHNNLQDCVHIKTVEAESKDNDDLTLPIDIDEDYGSFFFVVYAHSKLWEKGPYYISRTQTLTSMFISMSYI